MGVAIFPAAAAASGVKPYIAEFTSSGTWTAPTGVTVAEIFVVGGGGGGGGAQGGANNYYSPGGGGGGGGVIKRTVAVTPGTGYTVTVGSGGAGGSATTTTVTNGGNGGNSSFGSLATAFGGGGGGSRSDNASQAWAAVGTYTNGPSGGHFCQMVTNANSEAGGGGGALTEYINRNFTFSAQQSAINPTSTQFPNFNFGSQKSKTLQGSQGNVSTNDLTGASVGNPGIEGYGGGGGGGWMCANAADNQTTYLGFGRDGGGNGGGAFSSGTAGTVYNGSNATANTGGGGGGGNFRTSGSSLVSTGGNGAAGYVKVVYWA
jgi:hypothetical protein